MDVTQFVLSAPDAAVLILVIAAIIACELLNLFKSSRSRQDSANQQSGNRFSKYNLAILSAIVFSLTFTEIRARSNTAVEDVMTIWLGRYLEHPFAEREFKRLLIRTSQFRKGLFETTGPHDVVAQIKELLISTESSVEIVSSMGDARFADSRLIENSLYRVALNDKKISIRFIATSEEKCDHLSLGSVNSTLDVENLFFEKELVEAFLPEETRAENVDVFWMKVDDTLIAKASATTNREDSEGRALLDHLAITWSDSDTGVNAREHWSALNSSLQKMGGRSGGCGA